MVADGRSVTSNIRSHLLELEASLQASHALNGKKIVIIRAGSIWQDRCVVVYYCSWLNAIVDDLCRARLELYVLSYVKVAAFSA